MNTTVVVVTCGLLFVIIVISGVLMYLKMKKDWESKLASQDREIMKQSVTMVVQERESCMRQKLNAQKHSTLKNETVILNDNVHTLLRNKASKLYNNDIPYQRCAGDRLKAGIDAANTRAQKTYQKNKAYISQLGDRSQQTLYSFVELDKYVKRLNDDVIQLGKRVEESLVALTRMQPDARNITMKPSDVKRFTFIADNLRTELKEVQARINIVYEMQQAERGVMQQVNPARVSEQRRQVNLVAQDVSAVESSMTKIISPDGTDLLQGKLNQISNSIVEFETILKQPAKVLRRCTGNTCLNEDQFKKFISSAGRPPN